MPAKSSLKVSDTLFMIASKDFTGEKYYACIQNLQIENIHEQFIQCMTPMHFLSGGRETRYNIIAALD